jgi:aspartate/methionine/tyrosine aminotransferase
MKPSNSVFSGLGTTVFEVMSRLAMEHGSINLGQGFPDRDGPEDVRRAAAEASIAGPNQYPPMMGLPSLRRAIADHGKRFYGFDLDWQSQVMVTSGATEALAACLFGLLEPGDEAVLIEPLYDSYLPIVRRAGAVARLVRLEPPDWRLPRDELSAAFSDRTKLILLNSPMNPASKVFDGDELAFIAGLVAKHDAYAVCDEVYEHLLFDGRRHIPLAGLPGMAERTLRIGSAGKIFSLTGWKVGWVVASPATLATVAKAHQYLTFTTPPNLQAAVAQGLAKDDAYFSDLAKAMERSRDLLAAGLKRVGFDVIDSHGTYFISADFRPLGFTGDDVEFCRHITIEGGVTAVPLSAFYDTGDVRHFARFAFCKQDDVLEEAIARLARLFA